MSLDYNSLTLKQKKVYAAIEAFIKAKGIPPTVREIGEMIGEKTPGAVQGILNRLEQKGVLKREVGMARSIQLISADSKYAEPIYIPEIKRITRRNIHDLLGVYNIINYQPMPPALIESGKSCFMLSCPDNSLYDSGIRYEDVLIINREISLKDEDIVLVLYEDHVLVRKYYQTSSRNTVVLKADSNLIGKELFDLEEVIILGKVVGKYSKL